MFKDLDPLLHSQLRLGIMSILISVVEADFLYIKEKTNATAGNISVQLEKLSQANYISIEKLLKAKNLKPFAKLQSKGKRRLRSMWRILKRTFNCEL